MDAGTGDGTPRIIKNIIAEGADPRSIEYLFITHCHYDHTGGAEAVRKETGCKIVAHELDARYLWKKATRKSARHFMVRDMDGAA